MVDFIIRYFNADKSIHYDVIVESHNLGIPSKYGFMTSLISFANYHGALDLDIFTDSDNLHKWPLCNLYVRCDSTLIFLASGVARFGHHGEPEGYRFF